MRKFVELAGGPFAHLVVIPTASEYAQSTDLEERMQLLFRRFGVLNVQFLHTRSRQDRQ